MTMALMDDINAIIDGASELTDGEKQDLKDMVQETYDFETQMGE